MKRVIAVTALAAGITTSAAAADLDAFSAAMAGPKAGLHETAMPDAVFSPATAQDYTAEEFRDGVKIAVRHVHGLRECEVAGATYHFEIDGWKVMSLNRKAYEQWRVRVWYAPGGDRMPVLVINDGMGVDHAALEPRYPGEDVARALRDAGHPVMLMQLKGFGDQAFPSPWPSVHPVFMFDAYSKARGTSASSIWIQDALNAACQLEAWHPGPIGVTGVSKSGQVAAHVALLNENVERVYLASGFSVFEDTYLGPNSWAYGVGERACYSRVGLLTALVDVEARLSYAPGDGVYGPEAEHGGVMAAVNGARDGWGVRRVTQTSDAPSHYYDLADVARFFD